MWTCALKNCAGATAQALAFVLTVFVSETLPQERVNLKSEDMMHYV